MPQSKWMNLLPAKSIFCTFQYIKFGVKKLLSYQKFQRGDSNPGHPWTRPGPTRPSVARCYRRKSIFGLFDENSNSSDWRKCRRETRKDCHRPTTFVYLRASKNPNLRLVSIWWCHPGRECCVRSGCRGHKVYPDIVQWRAGLQVRSSRSSCRRLKRWQLQLPPGLH